MECPVFWQNEQFLLDVERHFILQSSSSPPVVIVLTPFLIAPSLMEPHMNGTSLMNVSDGCPTLTCLGLKLRRCYFSVISAVSMTLVIIIIN